MRRPNGVRFSWSPPAIATLFSTILGSSGCSSELKAQVPGCVDHRCTLPNTTLPDGLKSIGLVATFPPSVSDPVTAGVMWELGQPSNLLRFRIQKFWLAGRQLFTQFETNTPQSIVQTAGAYLRSSPGRLVVRPNDALERGVGDGQDCGCGRRRAP